jgi:hypothetical protein
MTFGLSGAAMAGIAVAGSTLISGRAQADAASSAAAAQAGSAQAGIEEQRRQFDAIQKLLAPYVSAGKPALEAQQAFLGLKGPEAERAAIERIRGGETFQALASQGEEALLQRASATGGLRGGNIQGALAQFRPALLSNLIDQQYGRLGGMTKQPFEILKLSSEAIIKEQEAKFAPDQFLNDLNLTKEQISQAKAARRASDAAAAKSGADAKRAQAEANQILSGIIPADKRPEAEAKFRKEYSDQTKGYQEVKSAYGRVLASQETAAGDLALIFNYMKMLDPGSVVREGEFATAQNAAGVPDRIKNLYNNLNRGERLKSSQRPVQQRT